MQRSFNWVRSCEPRPSATKSLRATKLAISSLLSVALLGGCVLAPAGLSDEHDALDKAGSSFEPPVEERVLPELSARPDWHELLSRAFVANGEIEANYFEWKAALQRVEIAAGWPNTNLMPSVSYLLSGGGMKAWDRTTVSLGFDPMQNLSFPSKVRKAGEIALEQARESGSRFVASKFALQRRVLDNWLELALLEERSRIQQQRVELGRLAFDTATQRAALRGDQRDLLRTQVEQREAEIEFDRLQVEARASRAMLNGMLARAADAPLELGGDLPDPRPIPADDAALIAAGVENNPDLRALTFAVSAQQNALELARLQYIPDFNPFVGFTGSIEQTVGVSVSLPTKLPQIRAGIEEATAMLRRADAQLRQAQFDRGASFVAALYVLRFSESQAAFLDREVRPAAEQFMDSAQQAYSTGAASFVDLIDAQRVLLDVRLAVAEARIERERRLAEIEELGGFDIETLSARSSPPAGSLDGQEVARHE
jgi:outer membrane protein TolC